MGLDHSDHIFGTILDVYAAAGSTRTNDFIDNSRPCDHNRKLRGSSHITPKFVTLVVVCECVSNSSTISSSTSHKLFRLVARPNADVSHDLHLQSLATIGGTCKRAITNNFRR